MKPLSTPLVLLTFIMLLVNSCTPPPPTSRPCYSATRQISENANTKMLWSKTNVWIEQAGSPMILSTPNRIILNMYDETSAASSSRLYITAFETLSGNKVWSKPASSPSMFATYAGNLYHGAYNKIEILDGSTGNLLQEINFSSGNLLSLQVRSGNIYAYTGSGRSFDYNNQKNIVNYTEVDFARAVVFIDKNTAYVEESNKIKAIDIHTLSEIWETDSLFIGSLVFTENAIFGLRFEGLRYQLYAISKENGSLIWKKEIDVVSNIATNGTDVYVLTIDGSLLLLDQETGQEIRKIEISPTPFVVHDPNVTIGGYYVAVDSTNNVVAFTLGDSCQLVALQIIP